MAGLLCDDKGIPVSIEIFPGSTTDTKTFSNQIKKTATDFGCQKVTFVGDRGMIKNKQIEELRENEFHYITGISKAQIQKLIRTGVFQLGLFEVNLCEVKYEGERYILRYNPVRAEEMKAVRLEKQKTIKKYIKGKNEYLKEHPRAKIEVALEKANSKIKQLKANKWLFVEEKGRKLILQIDREKLNKAEELDGCYCLKTDLPASVSKNTVHNRYKDLALVEQAFRASKTINLEMRPWYVITEQSSRGRALII
ncbi:MAG: transposase, partial [Candidatus Magnetoglobus multicellularis str. Araruama]